MIEFSIETAMRLNEQLTLKWDQVDLKKYDDNDIS